MTAQTIERTGVENAMRAAGFSRHHYTQYAGDLANFLSRGQVTIERVQEYARAHHTAVTRQQAQTFINALLGAARENEVGGGNQLTPGFTRERAATVIRQAAQVAGLNMANVEQVLHEAGLTDPTPDGDAPAWAHALTQRVDRLEGVARSRGLI